MDVQMRTLLFVLLMAICVLDSSNFVIGGKCKKKGKAPASPLQAALAPEQRYVVISQQATYGEAHALCQQQGLTLPMPKTRVENLELFSSSAYHNFFLGLAVSTKKNWRGMYQWADGAFAEWTNWAPGSPNKDKDCVLFQKMFIKEGTSRARWVSGSCDKPASVVVCQDPAVTDEMLAASEDSLGRQFDLLDEEPPTVAPKKNAKCAAGWAKFGSTNCVKLLKRQDLQSWEEGREACKALGGDLAVPTSAELGKQLIKLSHAEGACATFIGVVRKAPGQNQWMTVSEGAVRYFDWTRHEPNNGGPAPYTGMEDCVEVWWRGGPDCPKSHMPSGDGWNDVPCKLARPLASAACMKRKGE